MASDPAWVLQRAIFAALTGTDCQTAAGVTFRVYDAVPTPPTFPYAVLANAHVLADLAQGYDGSNVSAVVTVWSRTKGSAEVKAVAGAVRDALAAIASLEGGQEVVEASFVDTVYGLDVDGLTHRATVTFEYLTQPSPTSP